LAIENALNLTDEQKAARKEMREIQAAMMKEVLGLLTPEQKEKAGIKEPGKKGGTKKPRAKEKAAE
jgi:hypothetical protein